MFLGVSNKIFSPENFYAPGHLLEETWYEILNENELIPVFNTSLMRDLLPQNWEVASCWYLKLHCEVKAGQLGPNFKKKVW